MSKMARTHPKISEDMLKLPKYPEVSRSGNSQDIFQSRSCSAKSDVAPGSAFCL